MFANSIIRELIRGSIMKKRFLGLILALCLVIPTFVGCSLYTKNTEKINSAVAIRVGDEVITREELQNTYTTYYNYGYSYVYPNADDLMDYVVRTLVSQKVALITAKKTVKITEEDFDKIIETIKESLLDAIDSREKTIYENKGEELPERLCDGKDCTIESHEHKEEEKSEPYKPYESVIVKEITDLGVAIPDSAKTQKIAELIAELTKECQDSVEKYGNNYRLSALNEYIAELVQVDAINGKKTEKHAAFKAQVEQMVNYYEEQRYVEKLQEYVESKIKIEDSEVLDKYQELLNIEMQTYAGDSFATAFEKSDNKNMFLYYGYATTEEDKDAVNEEDKIKDIGNKNGYLHVQHLLIQFSDEVKAELSKLPGYGKSEKELRFHLGQQWLDTSIAGNENNTKENAPEYCWFPETDEDKNTAATFMSYKEWTAYINLRDTYISGLKTTYKDPETGKTAVYEDGEHKGESIYVTLNDVIEEINATFAECDTDIEKAQAFRKLMFKYGSDEGMFKVDTTTEVMGYVLPADQTKFSNDIGNNASGFVGEFVVGAYKLAKAGGLVSDEVVSDYGVHIMLNLGETKSGAVVELNREDAAAEAATITAMKDTYLSKSYGQSVYEYVYSKILTEKKSSAYTDFINEKKADIDIEYILTTYKKVFNA